MSADMSAEVLEVVTAAVDKHLAATNYEVRASALCCCAAARKRASPVTPASLHLSCAAACPTCSSFYAPAAQKAAEVIKETLDKKYGPTWQVIVGEGFGYNGEGDRAAARGRRGAAAACVRGTSPRSLADLPPRRAVTHHKDHMHFCMYGEKLGILVFKS